MFGVGIHQHQTAFLIVTALAFHDDFAAKVDLLLAEYGFSDAQGSYDLLQRSYAHARAHDGEFFDIPYGTGIMADFARNFADVVEEMAADINMIEEIKPLLTICRSGCTDGKVNRIVFPTLEEIIAFQKTYSPEIFDNPNVCARTVFQDVLQKTPNSCMLASG